MAGWSRLSWRTRPCPTHRWLKNHSPRLPGRSPKRSQPKVRPNKAPRKPNVGLRKCRRAFAHIRSCAHSCRARTFNVARELNDVVFGIVHNERDGWRSVATRSAAVSGFYESVYTAENPLVRRSSAVLLDHNPCQDSKSGKPLLVICHSCSLAPVRTSNARLQKTSGIKPPTPITQLLFASTARPVPRH